MNDSTKKILKSCLNKNKFVEYNEILRLEIICIFVTKIQEKNSFFLYSTIIELLENVEIYLAEKDIINCRYFYDILKKDYEPEVLAEYLTDLYQRMAI